MRKLVFPFAAVLVLLAGCGNGDKSEWTPEKRASAANKAGLAASSGWLLIAKPDKETVTAVKVVVDKIRANLTAYQDGGFVASLPGIDEALGKALEGDDNKVRRIAAHNLAKTLLEELDKLFEDHPEWKTLGSEVSAIIGAFLDGSSSAFDPYLIE